MYRIYFQSTKNKKNHKIPTKHESNSFRIMIPGGTKRRTSITVKHNNIAIVLTEQNLHQFSSLVLPLYTTPIPHIRNSIQRSKRHDVAHVGGDLVTPAPHQIEQRRDGVLLGAHAGGGGEVEEVGKDADTTGGLAKGIHGVLASRDLRDHRRRVLHNPHPTVLQHQRKKRGNRTKVNHRRSVNRMKRDGE